MVSVHFLTTSGQSICPMISIALYGAAQELMNSGNDRLDVKSKDYEFTIETKRRYHSFGVFSGYHFTARIESEHRNPGKLSFLCDVEPTRHPAYSSSLN